jgi:hypothetical protein
MGSFQCLLNEAKTRKAGTAVCIADGKNARGNSSFRRLAIAGGDDSSRRGRWCACSVIGDGNQDRIEQPSLPLIRHAPVQQEPHHIAEARVAHQGGDSFTADAQLLTVSVRDRRSPRLYDCAFLSSR